MITSSYMIRSKPNSFLIVGPHPMQYAILVMTYYLTAFVMVSIGSPFYGNLKALITVEDPNNEQR